MKSQPPTIIVALDLPDRYAALRIVNCLHGLQFMCKIGLELFAAGDGVQLAKDLLGANRPVFADLKLLDIPQTVARATERLAKLGVTYLTVHAQEAALRAAVAAAENTQVLAVTLLTSVSATQLKQEGYAGSVEDYVVGKAELAIRLGCAGVVCSPQEVAVVRQAIGPGPKIVTPGISTGRRGKDDQVRTANIDVALAAGADHVVVGRAIYTAPDPRKALMDLLREAQLNN